MELSGWNAKKALKSLSSGSFRPFQARKKRDECIASLFCMNYLIMPVDVRKSTRIMTGAT